MKSASDPRALGLVLALSAAAAGLFACRSTERDRAHAGRQEPTECATCHMPEFKATNHPPHEGARPTTCGVCHTQTSWHHWRVDHPWWELTGAHARAAADKELAGKEKQGKCLWCHRGDPSTFKDTKKECVACHEEDRETSHFPGHDEFALTCQDCHSTEAWKPAKRPASRTRPSDGGAEITADAGTIHETAHADAGAAVRKPTTAPRPTAPPATTATAAPKPPSSAPRPDVITRPSRHR